MPTYRLPMKTRTRQFRFDVDVPLVTQWVWDVVDGIENDELMVFDPHDEYALENIRDASGALLLEQKCSTVVSIREWLCVGCQHIGVSGVLCGKAEEADSAAYYLSNADEVLWPQHSDLCFPPPGPAAFVSEIVLSPQTLSSAIEAHPSRECWFKRIVAHELVHAFDVMKLVVPAFMDWRAFWKNVMNEGTRCDIAASRYHVITGCVDNYDTELEFSRIQQYWPSKVEEWLPGASRRSAWPKPPSTKRRRRK